MKKHENKFTLGIDFGTLSARAVVADVRDGREMGVSESVYRHGVMTDSIPCGIKLRQGWALQHPADYTAALKEAVREALKISKVNPADIIGMGVDFTSCTVMPVDDKGKPLCFYDKFASEPHAYVKLWKHHAAQDYADIVNRVTEERGESLLNRYGGKASAEWFVPKIMQIAAECPEVYDSAAYFTEAGDWIVGRLTGNVTRSESMAAYKCFYGRPSGFPSDDFFKALEPRLEGFTEKKLRGKLLPPGALAGYITEDAAEELGLVAGTPVAAANIDAHVCVAAAGRPEENSMLSIIGTSSCDIILGRRYCSVPGICGTAEDGAVPGFYAYEAGQSCVGDHFDWFVRNFVSPDLSRTAEARGISLHEALSERAAAKRAGESGLLALDWWNGNRSVLNDAALTGLMLGFNLSTGPEDVYRALIEATAFGLRMIIENFERHGIGIKRLFAAGGIADKNDLVMNIYASVTGRTVRTVRSHYAAALGSAIFGAVAAGGRSGGYDSAAAAAAAMGGLSEKIFKPDEDSAKIYEKMFSLYRRLHDDFGKNTFMKDLLALKELSLSGRHKD